jgi:hypothetical protein
MAGSTNTALTTVTTPRSVSAMTRSGPALGVGDQPPDASPGELSVIGCRVQHGGDGNLAVRQVALTFLCGR